MKTKFRFLSFFLALFLVLCLSALASCGTAGTAGTESDESTTTTVAASDNDTVPAVTEFTVTFVPDDHVTVTVYQTQADMTNNENGETTLTAYARDKESGVILTDGTGQVNFLLTFDEGYEIDNISINKEEGSGYTNLKGSADTEVTNGYRITKITDDLTVTVTSKSTEAEEDLTQGYQVTFNVDEHISVTVFKTKDMTTGGTENATVAYSRNDSTGALTKESGQVNFILTVDSGYVLESFTITEGYNELKGSADTGVLGGYRITKITDHLTVTVTTTDSEDLSNGYQVTFNLDDHVKALVYKTQDTDSETGTESTVAYSRDGVTGVLTTTEGQVNFVLVFDEGYELDEISYTQGTYKNAKKISANTYRITKITDNMTVTVTAKEIV